MDSLCKITKFIVILDKVLHKGNLQWIEKSDFGFQEGGIRFYKLMGAAAPAAPALTEGLINEKMGNSFQ